MEWYAANNIYVMPKDKNSPNTPEPLQIEKYWAIVKRNHNKRRQIVVNEMQLEANIRNIRFSNEESDQLRCAKLELNGRLDTFHSLN